MNVAIIGGGAAGFFSAIAVKENYPGAGVIIFEKTKQVLSKVKISGGGKCNVTNGCTSISELCKAYPRGGKNLKKAFHTFNTSDTIRWFESRGVPLVMQDDNRVFPASQHSQSIVDCFLREAKRLKIKIESNKSVKAIKQPGDGLELEFLDENPSTRQFDKVIIATGGSPKRQGLEWLEALNHKIEDPVPSLFTFNIPDDTITQLMGVVVENTLVNIQGTKIRSGGPLLVTHWGMSGPAILKLSSFGARVLSEMDYKFKLQVNWINETNHAEVMETLDNIIREHAKKKTSNFRPWLLPERLWLHLLEKCEISPDKLWGEIGKKASNKLVNILTNDLFEVNGKTTFKEEFVTCGGISLQSVDFKTMQSKVCKNLYFAGEILDIDAITGGYNFQAAWTTGFIAGKLE